MKIKGTIVYNDFEGGFWGIMGDDNQPYRPINPLPTTVQKPGCRVEAVLKPIKALSFAMWGRSVEIDTIRPL